VVPDEGCDHEQFRLKILSFFPGRITPDEMSALPSLPYLKELKEVRVRRRLKEIDLEYRMAKAFPMLSTFPLPPRTLENVVLMIQSERSPAAWMLSRAVEAL
jgi:hypothetical protein